MDFMQSLYNVNYDLVDGLGIDRSMAPDTLLDYLADSIFGITLTDGQRNLLFTFLSAGIASDRTRSNPNPPLWGSYDLQNSNYLWRKIPRTICLMGDLMESNRR